MSRPRANEALVDEAAQWMALLQSGQMNAQERQAFHDWRAADPQHEQIIVLMGGGLGRCAARRCATCPGTACCTA